MKQYKTSPKRQYVATGIFAILAMISGLSVMTEKTNEHLSAETMSVKDIQNTHSETFETILLKKQLKNNK